MLGIIVLFFVSRSSGSSSASTGSAGPAQVVQTGQSDAVQVAELQAATASAAQQNAGILANNQLSAALAGKQIDAATTNTANQLAAQVELEKLHVSGDVQNNANNFAYQTTLSNNATVLGVTKLNDDTQVAISRGNTASQTSLFQTLINAFAGTNKTNQPAPVVTPAPIVGRNFDGGVTQTVPVYAPTYSIQSGAPVPSLNPNGSLRGR